MIRHPRISPLFPHPPLSRSEGGPAEIGQLDLGRAEPFGEPRREGGPGRFRITLRRDRHCRALGLRERCHLRDRKSTRLNSSHLVISYAVFCLKKKKT